MSYGLIALIAAPFTLLGLFVVWRAVVLPGRRASVTRMREPVRGTMRITEMPEPTDEDPMWQNGIVAGTVTIPGLPAFAYRQRVPIPTDRFPKVGDALPVIVNRADHGRLAIQWDEVGLATAPVVLSQ